jgi:hypothetical protein
MFEPAKVFLFSRLFPPDDRREGERGPGFDRPAFEQQTERKRR